MLLRVHSSGEGDFLAAISTTSNLTFDCTLQAAANYAESSNCIYQHFVSAATMAQTLKDNQRLEYRKARIPKSPYTQKPHYRKAHIPKSPYTQKPSINQVFG
jgi:hypothetical protein